MTHQTKEHGDKGLDDLLSRIGECLADDALTSSGADTLKDEATQLMGTIQEQAEQSRKRLLEPLLLRPQIDEAKQRADAAEVDCQRLAAAIEVLGDRVSDLLDIECEARKLDRFLTIQESRDQAADLIKERFPKIHADLMSMIETIMESNLEVDNVNLDLPEGKSTLERSEGVARGFTDIGSYQTPRSVKTFRITQLVLPCAKDPSAVAWPERLFYDRDILQTEKGFSHSLIAGRWKKSPA